MLASAVRNRWLEWQPKALAFTAVEGCGSGLRTQGSIGFEGVVAAASPEIGLSASREQACAGISWADWKAAQLNQLFHDQGVMKTRGRITAATVRDGERIAGVQKTQGVADK